MSLPKTQLIELMTYELNEMYKELNKTKDANKKKALNEKIREYDLTLCHYQLT
nr:MAG: hypothetical protein [uncultured archaeon]